MQVVFFDDYNKSRKRRGIFKNTSKEERAKTLDNVFNNDGLGYLFLILVAFSFIVLVFIVSCYNLARFKRCYDNNFVFNYCSKYKNY